ncbi:MAG: hypothetical protein GX087_02265 [Desulfobulbaceae bacterium]|nr:hypothetical protein [Desulfobulbaceae bacterium]
MNVQKLGVPELLAAGQALFGNQWQTALSCKLGWYDARRIRQWLTGNRKNTVRRPGGHHTSLQHG